MPVVPASTARTTATGSGRRETGCHGAGELAVRRRELEDERAAGREANEQLPERERGAVANEAQQVEVVLERDTAGAGAEPAALPLRPGEKEHTDVGEHEL